MNPSATNTTRQTDDQRTPESQPIPASIDRLLEASQGLGEWYWTHGVHRKGPWALGKGSWLDRLHRIRKRARIVQRSIGPNHKPCLALWGPSQSGKSTLLSDSIDGDGDAQGRGTALQWREELVVPLRAEALRKREASRGALGLLEAADRRWKSPGTWAGNRRSSAW